LIRPQIDIADLDEPLVTRYVEWTAQRCRPVSFIDLTHDCGIPVLAAVAHDRAGGRISIGFGSGAAVGDAARHAIGELAQFESNVSLIEHRVDTWGEEGVSQEAFELLRWWRDARIEQSPHLLASSIMPPPPARVALDLQACHEICGRANLRFLAVDMTRSKNVPAVVRVTVPGMRPMWPRFAPGRLFEVPVRLGWLPRQLDLSELNPVPMMF
jgi:ribosomal protein S12 methylthiotransferase accessory factor